MVWPALLLVGALAPPEPVTLSRVFRVGHTYSYAFKSSLTAETKVKGVDTWMPEDYDVQYAYTLDVLKEKVDGIVDARYRRPSMTFTEGETVDSPPKVHPMPVNLDLLLTLSPINDMLDAKDLGKATKKVGKARWTSPDPLGQGGFIGEIIDDIYSLAMFSGTLQSALDLAPRLPTDPVVPGDQWRYTASYQPQRLAGTENKMAMQRLDYTYTYKGLVDTPHGRMHRVTGELKLDTDIAEFLKQVAQDAGAKSQLGQAKLQLSLFIAFDLDPKTFDTRLAVAQSGGGFTLVRAGAKVPEVQQRLRGRSRLELVAVTKSAPPAKGG